MGNGGAQPAVSIIIPCRDHARELDRCLRSLGPQRSPFDTEILVVDSSADDSVAAIAGNHAGVRLLRSQACLLPGQARNLGTENANGRFLAFIDADCVAEPGWIAALHAALEEGHRAVGGAVLHGDPWNPVSTVDNLMQFVDLHPMRPGGVVELLPSCNLAIRREDFDDVGRFPELDLPAGEDVLFCAKLTARWPDGLYFEPTMQVRHFGRSGLREFWLHQVTFGYCRGACALQLKPFHRRLGRRWMLAPAVAAKRLSYLLSRAARHPPSFARMVVLSPLLVVGIAGWCIGFRRGCTEDKLVQNVTQAVNIGRAEIEGRHD
jgi:glycosyltransferase involved in cell wall biosynthesis